MGYSERRNDKKVVVYFVEELMEGPVYCIVDS
jgi:hypothetical protein